MRTLVTPVSVAAGAAWTVGLPSPRSRTDMLGVAVIVSVRVLLFSLDPVMRLQLISL
ncbi:hypothetical protein [Kineococcus sp. G2]|uniref:hypothetical protein n=1 Tax=Kineococcus sp. G2 TaxID=3127484 RepID=UPI00301D2E9C